MGKKKNQQISNDKEIINFGKLKEAQKTAEKEELELTKRYDVCTMWARTIFCRRYG